MIPLGSAHVTIDPKETVPGYQKYWVNVPNEKEIATTELRLVIPSEVDVTGVLPLYGWTHSEKKETAATTAEKNVPAHDEDDEEAGSQKITEITWSGGTINPGEYMMFGLQARYAGDPKKIVWKAYQKYADGQIVAWDNSSDKNPAPTISMISEPAINTLNNQMASLEKNMSATSQKETNTMPLFWLSSVALPLSIVALIMSLKGRKMEMK